MAQHTYATARTGLLTWNPLELTVSSKPPSSYHAPCWTGGLDSWISQAPILCWNCFQQMNCMREELIGVPTFVSLCRSSRTFCITSNLWRCQSFDSNQRLSLLGSGFHCDLCGLNLGLEWDSSLIQVHPHHEVPFVKKIKVKGVKSKGGSNSLFIGTTIDNAELELAGGTASNFVCLILRFLHVLNLT